MLGYVFLGFVLVTTSYASYLDLKTSEVPDWISLLTGAGAAVYYLYQSVSAPFSSPELLVIAATTATMLGVATYLKLYRILPDTPQIQKAIDVMEDQTYGVRHSDIGGTVLYLTGAALFYHVTVQTGVLPITEAFVTGTALFAFGWGMYLAGMWGGADAFILGAVGYALPHLPAAISPLYTFTVPFPLMLVLTVFCVGAVYSIGYAAVAALRDPEAMEIFREQLYADRDRILRVSAGYVLTAAVAGYLLQQVLQVSQRAVFANIASFYVLLLGMMMLYRFLQTVEDHVMQNTIPTDQLVPGDVLAEPLPGIDGKADGKKIVGVSADQIGRIRDQYETVTVKTGVRFIVAFPVAILILMYVGDWIRVLASFV